jgi:hypothetical protein
MTVLEEEVVERTISSTRRYVVRRPTDLASSAGGSDWSADDLDDADDDVDADDNVDTSSTSPSNGRRAVDDRIAGSQTPTKPTPVTERSSAPTADWSVD